MNLYDDQEKLKGNTITITQSMLRWIGSKSRLIQKYQLWEFFPTMQHKRIGNIYHHYLYLELMCGCYDDQTEILTEDGFVLFKDLPKNIKVATLVNGNLEYVYPTEYFDYDYNGDMYHIKCKGIDLLVTPNHKVYFKESRQKEYRLEEIQNIHYHTINFKSNCNWEGIYQEWFYLPLLQRKGNPKFWKYWNPKIPIEKIKMDNWLEFLGYFLSEGHTTKCYLFSKRDNRYYYSYTIGISQSKENNYDKYCRIQSCLNRLPFKFRSHEKGFEITNKQLYEYLKQFGKSYDKFIPKELKQLPKTQLQILFDALMLGDGSIIGKYQSIKNGKITIHERYYSISNRLIDDISEICLKIGHSFHKSIRKPRKNLFNKYNHIIESKYNSYELYIKKCKLITILDKHISIEKYQKKVYCIQVPSHIIYIRRYGNGTWCGNSASMFFNLRPNFAVLNDHNHDLYNFLTVVQDDTMYPQFQAELDKIYCGQDWIDQYALRTDNIGKALCFYLKNRYSNIGVQPVEFYKDLTLWKKIMTKCRLRILNEDAFDLLEEINKSPFDPKQNSTQYHVFADPPYVGTEYMYKDPFSEGKVFDHHRFAKLVHESTHVFYIIYGDNPLIRELYHDWYCMELETISNITKKPRTDLLLSNYPIKRHIQEQKMIQKRLI